jgi:hypothetical protein
VVLLISDSIRGPRFAHYTPGRNSCQLYLQISRKLLFHSRLAGRTEAICFSTLLHRFAQVFLPTPLAKISHSIYPHPRLSRSASKLTSTIKRGRENRKVPAPSIFCSRLSTATCRHILPPNSTLNCCHAVRRLLAYAAHLGETSSYSHLVLFRFVYLRSTCIGFSSPFSRGRLAYRGSACRVRHSVAKPISLSLDRPRLPLHSGPHCEFRYLPSALARATQSIHLRHSVFCWSPLRAWVLFLGAPLISYLLTRT